jgi:hypothetical protein
MALHKLRALQAQQHLVANAYACGRKDSGARRREAGANLPSVAPQANIGLCEEKGELALRGRVRPYERDDSFDLLRLDRVQVWPERANSNVLHLIFAQGASRAPYVYGYLSNMSATTWQNKRLWNTCRWKGKVLKAHCSW